jgi:predicted permease
MRSPGFAVVAILSIALGIGATTAIFTLVDQVLLRTLPVRDPHELVQMVNQGSVYGSNWGDGSELSYPMYQDLGNNNQVFTGVFCRFGFTFNVSANGRTERAVGEIVSGTYFPVLGVGAAIGRTLDPGDDRLPGGHPVAVLSHAFWSSRFAADPAIVGSTMVINSHPFTVVGVARPGFDGIELGRLTQVFVPTMMKAQLTPGWNGLDDRRWHWVRVFGRLRAGVSPEQAQAALQPFYRSRLELEVAEPAFAKASETARQRFLEKQLRVDPSAQGRSGFRRSLATPLWVLMAIAVGVLVIACANVANLLLARAAARQREMAVRLSVGASRAALIRQLLVESLMLASAGGIAGLALAAVGAPLVLGLFVNPDVPDPVSTRPDLRILSFAFGVATLTGVLFGLVPALRSTRPDLAPTLKDQASSVIGGHARLRKILVASQVAVSLLLLIGAVLFIRTLDNLLAVDVGFRTSALVSFSLDPPLNGRNATETKVFAKALLDRLRAAPGVESAGLSTVRLLERSQWSSTIAVDGYQATDGENMNQLCNSISPDFFRTMGIPFVAGRDFDARDELGPRADPSSRPETFRVAIANERFVRQYFGDQNPIGRRIGFGGDPKTPTPIEIVGVVKDSKYTEVRVETQRQLFFPFLESDNPSSFTIYVRARGDAASVFQAARQIVAGLDPNLPVHTFRTLDRQVAQSLGSERLVATMSTVFGTLATLLAIVGLYGVMAYAVTRRTREIGIRMALGARATDIAWLVLREALVVAVAGIAIGLPAVWWLGRYVGSQLYGVTATDPLAVGSAAVGLTLIAMLAALIPSRRAALVAPTTALRCE